MRHSRTTGKTVGKKNLHPVNEDYRHLLNERGSEGPGSSCRARKEDLYRGFIDKTKRVVDAKRDWSPVHTRNLGRIN